MPVKTDVLNQLGETELVLPDLVNRALVANDQVKYYLTLLQAARDRAVHPDLAASSLRAEREASGVDDASLDTVVADSVRDGDQLHVPRSSVIHARIVTGIRQMLEPITIAALADETSPHDAWNRRLEGILRGLAPPEGDRIPAAYVDIVSRANRDAGDSLHLLVMDLHRELNRLQAGMTMESLDGAKVYGLREPDRPLVAAFMAGINATAALKFDHPGLGTTATRIGDRLVIQNDIGTTDTHVFVVHVEGSTIRVIYTDIHAPRARFFQTLLEPLGFEWNPPHAAAPAAGYLLNVGELKVSGASRLADPLTFLGSRLVFLIDWNRARKRLGRILKKTDAVELLKWAADHNIGHRGFMQLGDVRLVYTALEQVAPAQLPSGARLDELLGREAAKSFLQAVLTIAAEGLREGRSARLIQDEIQAELLMRFQSAEHSALSLAEEHAALVAGLAGLVHDAMTRAAPDFDTREVVALAARAQAWAARGDELVKRSRTILDQAASDGPLAELFVKADEVADALERAAFLFTLMPPEDTTGRSLDELRDLAELLTRGTQEYTRAVACGRDAHRPGSRDEVNDFLVAVDAVIAFEHTADERQRTVQAALIKTCTDFRELHVLSEVSGCFEHAADALAQCANLLRDYVLDRLKAHR
jgi:uncharacterized protein Yka (UPF0111/DUF47 family)